LVSSSITLDIMPEAETRHKLFDVEYCIIINTLIGLRGVINTARLNLNPWKGDSRALAVQMFAAWTLVSSFSLL
jgi:hypothetical protein